MPIIQAQGKTIECEPRANLRQALIKNGVDLHNGAAKAINCRGLGTCGTCAVQVEGAVSVITWREKARLSLPPHSFEQNRRLACQLQVLGDIAVTKFNGFWGQDEHPIWTPESSG
jgi:ferredoxin